ncbi:MAG: radical SAM protein [Candidatus Woesearchaeota archaeon]
MRPGRKLHFLLKSALVYARYSLGKPVPFLVVIVPTKQCNLRCSYCEYYHNKSAVDHTLMPFPMMKSIVDQAAILGVPLISFSGGEPLLCNHLDDVAEYAHNKSIVLNLNTNATLITDSRAKLLAKYFDYIRISVDGCGTEYDKIVGTSGAYARMRKGLVYLQQHKTKNCSIGINIVYNKGRAARVKKVIEEFKDKVDFISVLPRFSFVQNPESGVDYADLRLTKLLSGYKDIKINLDFISASPRQLSTVCDFGKLYLAVYPSGAVMGCPFILDNSGFLGSISEESFVDILGKRISKPPCQGCYATCTTKVSKVFGSNLFQLLHHFWRLKHEYRL